MSNPLHTGRLVLTPENPETGVDAVRLAAVLTRIGLIGEPLPQRKDAFATGEHFAALIGFTGCAVQLTTAPAQDGAAFSHVVLRGPYPAPRLLSGRNTRPPRCPDCKKPLQEWREQLAACDISAVPGLRCRACGTAAPGWRWDWRQHGGFGRSFICIEEVFPGEGSPLPELTAAFGALGAGSWRHFFVQDG